MSTSWGIYNIKKKLKCRSSTIRRTIKQIKNLLYYSGCTKRAKFFRWKSGTTYGQLNIFCIKLIDDCVFLNKPCILRHAYHIGYFIINIQSSLLSCPLLYYAILAYICLVVQQLDKSRITSMLFSVAATALTGLTRWDLRLHFKFRALVLFFIIWFSKNEKSQSETRAVLSKTHIKLKKNLNRGGQKKRRDI